MIISLHIRYVHVIVNVRIGPYVYLVKGYLFIRSTYNKHTSVSVHIIMSACLPGFLADNPAVAFTAIVSPPLLSLLAAGETVVFDTVVTNVGDAYRNTTGLFRAPIQGVYVFNFALMMDPGFNEYIELVKNGYHVMWNYGHAPGSTHYISASRTATVQLQVNQLHQMCNPVTHIRVLFCFTIYPTSQLIVHSI